MFMKIRNRQRGFTLIELLIVVAIIGIIAALLIPNFLDALQKAKQKRTVSEIRNVGTAWFSWLTDLYGGAAAAGVDTYDLPGTATDHATVTGVLVDRYIQRIPMADAWNNNYEFLQEPVATILTVPNVIAMGSTGRNGTFDSGWAAGATIDVRPFDPTDYDQDIVWADGYFLQWPQGVGGAAGPP